MLTGLFVALSALLNRIRGDKTLFGLVPNGIKSLWYVAPAFGLLATLLGGLPARQGAALAGIFLIWGLGPWGRWFSLGRGPLPDRSPTVFEAAIEAASPNVHVRFFLRQCVVLPFAWLYIWYFSTGWLLALLPALILGAYEGAWRVWDRRRAVPAIVVAEAVSGALWAISAVS